MRLARDIFPVRAIPFGPVYSFLLICPYLHIAYETNKVDKQQFFRFCTRGLIMRGITALKEEGLDVLLATGMGFAVLFLSEMAHESCGCSCSSVSWKSSKDWIFL